MLAFARSWIMLFTFCKLPQKSFVIVTREPAVSLMGIAEAWAFSPASCYSSAWCLVFEIIFKLADSQWLLSEICEIPSSHKVLWVCDFLSHKARWLIWDGKFIIRKHSSVLGRNLWVLSDYSSFSFSPHFVPWAFLSDFHLCVPSWAQAFMSVACMTGKASYLITCVQGFPLHASLHATSWLGFINCRTDSIVSPQLFFHSSPLLFSLVSKASVWHQHSLLVASLIPPCASSSLGMTLALSP